MAGVNRLSGRRLRRVLATAGCALLLAGISWLGTWYQHRSPPAAPVVAGSATQSDLAAAALATLAVKGRAPMTGYDRTQFGGDWADIGGCSMRDVILSRDLTDVRTRSATDCTVLSGTLADPYTGKSIRFTRGVGTSAAVQIDHVVAIGDAWQTGAQQLPRAAREQLYNDPLELLAVDGPTNEQKGDGDAATWLPPNKAYRCRYIARQIAIKVKYHLWVTAAEHTAMAQILGSCPDQLLPATSSPSTAGT
ncbi:MAG TPA: HNH endonuclease family protein [Candidatus Saccharimonadales bacterium]|nr:HNH endonuclease family protein [Candidatus Saccharimonadales bacterium]